ncbi:hypothetical protein EV356DRAFT_69508 [Viridothelium virens]|uniref:Uncharacterized protein n=1 Tax=Viridothelium virens TaxID=1048519 RepID=A0A6A6HE27_VIRVR|nr:hypothetical protein EV356DRAFT_69508 [Viridothelium virens]
MNSLDYHQRVRVHEKDRYIRDSCPPTATMHLRYEKAFTPPYTLYLILFLAHHSTILPNLILSFNTPFLTFHIWHAPGYFIRVPFLQLPQSKVGRRQSTKSITGGFEYRKAARIRR